MDSAVVVSLVGAIMAALLGLTGIAGSTVSIAWFLFAVGSIFVILAIVFLVVEADLKYVDARLLTFEA